MSFLSVNNLRNRRVNNQNNIFGPAQMSISNFYTDSRQSQGMQTVMEDYFPACDKNDLKMSFGDELFINNLHLIPDPLKKNLADTLITEDKPKSKPKMENEVYKESVTHQAESYPKLSGITNFFSGVFNVLTSAMFRRAQSPVHFHDCVDTDSPEMAPVSWQPAKQEKDKNELAEPFSKCNKTNLEKLTEPGVKTDTAVMADCKNAALQCEDKLERVKELLSSKKVVAPPPKRSRRPKKVFVEAGSVEDCFEDAFCPEDLVCDPDEPHIEYYTPKQYHIEDFCEIQSPLPTKRGQSGKNTDFQTNVNNENECMVSSDPIFEETIKKDFEKDDMRVSEPKSDEESSKREVVSSCEDKLARLKAMLQEKRKKTILEPVPSPTESVPIKIKDKRFKNPNRTCSKRDKSKMKRNIDEDMLFANEIALDDSSVDNSPDVLADRCPFTEDDIKPDNSFFDEVRGRFRSDSLTDSEDAFQIVVADCPRRRKLSDCDSEDSFIVFEDSPDSCYTSNEVFDSDSDEESGLSDSGCMTSLSHPLTRTVTNLTEDGLYEDQCVDEVDFAFESDPTGAGCTGDSRSGVLLDATKKLAKKSLPEKKVTFSSQPPEVRVMRVWTFAAKQARIGNWERFSRDRDRFKRRIADVDMAVSWVLKPQHRARVVFQRFMPWWNAQKRRELAEKNAHDTKSLEEHSQHTDKTLDNSNDEIPENDLKKEDILKINGDTVISQLPPINENRSECKVNDFNGHGDVHHDDLITITDKLGKLSLNMNLEVSNV